MKPFLFFLIFLLAIGSASATFPITINGKTVPNSANTADKTEADQAQLLYQGKVQGFTLPTDPDISSITRGSIDFKRNSKAPPISQFFFFPNAAPLNEQTQQSESPTGAITYTVDEGPEKGPIVAMILLITIITVFFVIRIQGTKIKIILAVIILTAALFTSIKMTNTPTALLVQEYSAPEPQEIAPASNHINNAFTLTWTHGGPVTFLPEGGAPECSDGIDNTDFEDLLADCADPGCHTDGNESNPGSCDPTDDLEQDMLEYDQAPVVDNQIDVYDTVNWVQYFNGDFSVLVHCIDPACSNQAGTANCVGDTDPNDDAALTPADQTFLQTTQLADTDSRTVPASPICFNP